MKQLFSIFISLNLMLIPVSWGAKDNEQEKEKSSSTMNQVLALGTGIIGSNILLSCKLGSSTPSILTFFGGSVVYIGSEIMGAKAQQAFIKVKKDEIAQLKMTMTEGGDLQKGILEVKLKEEEDKLGFVKKRKMWMMAVGTIYTAATALAVAEMICTKSVVASATCTNWFSAGCVSGSALPSNKLLSTAVLAAYGYGVGSAGGGPISTYGTLLLTGLNSFVPALSSKISVAYQTPESRIATFGAGTALSLMVVKELMGIEKELQKNIEDLQKLLTDFNKKTNGSGGVEAEPSAGNSAEGGFGSGVSSSTGNQVKALANKNENKEISLKKSCLGLDASGNQTFSEAACNKPVRIPKPQLNSKLNLPTLHSVANTGNDMAQAVASGNLAAADLAAANLSANAMRVKEIQDNLLKQLNKDLKKQGKEPLEFDKEVERTLSSMRNNLQGGMSTAGGGFSSPQMKSGDAVIDEKSAEGTQDIKKASQGGGISFGSATSDMSENFNDDNEIGAEATKDDDLAATHSLEDFQTQESDIIKDPSVSLFQQLSNRYFLNYGKIFDTPKKDDAKSETK